MLPKEVVLVELLTEASTQTEKPPFEPLDGVGEVDGKDILK